MDIFLIELSGAKVALKKEMYFQSKKIKQGNNHQSFQSIKQREYLIEVILVNRM